MIHISEDNLVKIGPKKDLSRYISASLYALGKNDTINLVGRGNNIKRAIDILDILKRDYLDNPKYEVIVDSETFENRRISTVDIVLSGVKKGELKK